MHHFEYKIHHFYLRTPVLAVMLTYSREYMRQFRPKIIIWKYMPRLIN